MEKKIFRAKITYIIMIILIILLLSCNNDTVTIKKSDLEQLTGRKISIYPYELKPFNRGLEI